MINKTNVQNNLDLRSGKAKVVVVLSKMDNIPAKSVLIRRFDETQK